MKEEIWKPVVGYENSYYVSNYGRIKSLTRRVNRKDGKYNVVFERILKQRINPSTGYPITELSILGKLKTRSVHQLVAEAFLGYVRCGHKLVVDHINGIKSDNRLDNLQIISHRNNVIKGKRKKSNFGTGVRRSNNKFRATIFINGKDFNLGSFDTAQQASNAYQNKLLTIKP